MDPPAGRGRKALAAKATEWHQSPAYGGHSLGDPPVSIGDVSADDSARFSTGYAEFDRVLGSGWLPGALTLLVGDPGVGKSSLILQASAHVARTTGKVLYVTGEESTQQVRLRADRLGAIDDNLYVIAETNLEEIIAHASKDKPRILVIDSIQTLFHPDIESAPGSVSQVRECAGELMQYAKSTGVATILVGHVTKDGTLAGPRVLEHIVDTVLYLEGDRHGDFRVLRAVKNRFGGTHEIGLFEMRDRGLLEVSDASGLLLSERPGGVSGSIVVPAMEGTRPLLIEIQALVSDSPYAQPRRTSDGIDVKRVHLLLAVLEKRAGLMLGSSDVYVRIAGGLTVSEPAIDLGLVLSLASSFRDVAPARDCAVFGEIGLAGEVRGVSRGEQRIREAAKMGFRRMVVPRRQEKDGLGMKNIELIGVDNVADALKVVLT